MKQFIAAILILVYLGASSGVVINSHYCMKKLVSVKLFETKAEQCGQCGMEMHDNPGCCHDDTKFVKLVQDQVKSPVPFYNFSLAAVLPAQTSAFLLASLFNTDTETYSDNHSPPLRSEQHQYIVFRVFRI